MTTIYILTVITYVHNGSTVSFQEFNSLEQCMYVREFLNKQDRILQAQCFKK